MEGNYNWAGGYALESIEAKLLNEKLWRKFHAVENEMIITKAGRKMFPTLRVQMSNMEESANYYVYLEFIPASNSRFKYSSGTGWVPAGSEESHRFNYRYMHPQSPASGRHWMSQPVSFGGLKLTNVMIPPAGQIVLSSMHKYQPRIVIVRTSESPPFKSFKVITFEETQFIAVTAYQNAEVTRLKIDFNAFAKGFRADGRSKCKRKAQELTKDDETESNNKIINIETGVAESSNSTGRLEDMHPATSSTSRNEETLSNSNVMPLTYYPNCYQHYNYYNHRQYVTPPPPPPPPLPHQMFSSFYSYFYNGWVTPYGLNMYSPPPVHFGFPDNSKELAPKKTTDFSIRAILEL